MCNNIRKYSPVGVVIRAGGPARSCHLDATLLRYSTMKCAYCSSTALPSYTFRRHCSLLLGSLSLKGAASYVALPFARRSRMLALRAALYRLLASGPLPPAPDAVEALRRTHSVGTEEMAVLLRACIDPSDPAEDACITECIRRLRDAGDGGEKHLDKRLAPGVQIVPLVPEASGFTAWSRKEEPDRSAPPPTGVLQPPDARADTRHHRSHARAPAPTSTRARIRA